MRLVISTLAAGKGSRFGGKPKLMESLQGRPVIDWSLEGALHMATVASRLGFVTSMRAITGAHAPEITKTIEQWKQKKQDNLNFLSDFSIVFNPDFEIGLASSVKIGMSPLNPSIGSETHWAFLLGDEPLIDRDHLTKLTEAAANSLVFSEHKEVLAVVSEAEDRKGVPLFLKSQMKSYKEKIKGDQGFNQILKNLQLNQVLTIQMNGHHGDIDTNQDLDRFQKLVHTFKWLFAFFIIGFCGCKPQRIQLVDLPVQPTQTETKPQPKRTETKTPCPSPKPYSLSEAVSPDFVYELQDDCPPITSQKGDGLDPGAPSSTDAPSPNFGSRNGTKISGIILHNTESRFSSAVTWLRNPASKVSAHLVIGREGNVSRLVADESTAWHSKQVNKSTLGIELEAWKAGQGLAKAQEESLIRQVRFWMEKYNIPLSKIQAHREHVNTDCPIYIWPDQTVFNDWKNKIKP